MVAEFEVSDRLRLVPATLAHLEAELRSPQKFGRMLRATVPEGWPPGEYDKGAIEYFRDRFLVHPELVGWLVWYGVLLEGRRRVLVGAAGYFGTANEAGEVEIGYSVVAKYRRRGLASELVSGLVRRLVAFPEVTRVIAHTTLENVASVRVLEQQGFRQEGVGEAPGSIRFAKFIGDRSS